MDNKDKGNFENTFNKWYKEFLEEEKSFNKQIHEAKLLR